ncbi:MAG TPA: XrtA system polysaccharide chain length determinant [Acetobacteraceae bacterium]|nr:XrtA system polysaccharide chain length determinant [Acetobacteraceae bacterium]
MDSMRVFLRQQIVAVWRHRWMAVAISWVVCGIGWAAVTVLPNQFESSARVYVNVDAVLTPLLNGIAVEGASAATLDYLQRTLLSQPNMDKVISKTGLDLQVTTPESRQRMVEQLARTIHLSSQTNTLFTISYRNPSPQMAHDVVQALLDIFAESTTGADRADLENAQHFLDQQIASYAAQLRAADQRRAAFRTKYIDLLPNSEYGGATALESARAAEGALEGQLEDAMAARAALLKELAATPQYLPFGEGGPGQLSANAVALAQAENKLAVLRLQYTEKDPDVIAQRALVQAIRSGKMGSLAPTSGSAHATASTGAPNQLYQDLKLKVVDANVQIASLQRQLKAATANRGQMDKIARAVPEVEAQSKNLDRDYNVLRTNYEALLARRESASIAQAADTQADKVKLTVVDPPLVPHTPVAPNRLLLFSAVLVLGIGAGVGLAFLRGQLDSSFRSVDDLRSLGLPVLGALSLVGTPAVRQRVVSVLGFGAAVMLLVVVFGGLIAHTARLISVI